MTYEPLIPTPSNQQNNPLMTRAHHATKHTLIKFKSSLSKNTFPFEFCTYNVSLCVYHIFLHKILFFVSMVNSLLVFLKHDGQQGDFSCFKAIVDQYESQPLCMIRPRAPSRASLSSCCHKSRDSNNGDNDKDLLPYHGSRDPPSPPPENCHCYENANFRPEGGNLCWGRSCFKGIKAFGDWGWIWGNM